MGRKLEKRVYAVSVVIREGGEDDGGEGSEWEEGKECRGRLDAQHRDVAASTRDDITVNPGPHGAGGVVAVA